MTLKKPMDNINPFITTKFYENILTNAIHEAGPKYTPGLEKGAPNLEIEELIFAFDILGRTRKFYEYLCSLAEELEKESRLNYSIAKITELKLGINKKCLEGFREDIENLKALITAASERHALNNDINIEGISLIARKCLNTIGDIDSILYRERDAEKPKDKDKIEAINHLIYTFRKLGDIVRRIKDFCDRPDVNLANNPFLLLLGEAGIGKTHFLCDIAKNRIADGYPTIILLGHHFQQFTDPGKQIIKVLCLDFPFEKFIRQLHRQAVKTKTRCLIVIDAINEGDKNAWRKSLNGFVKQLRPFKGVGLIVSCRTPFEKITIPKRPKPDATVLFHPGFRDIELDAQAAFFKYYKIPTPEVPLLTPEFSNPLFLKLFCKALEEATVKKKHKQIKDIASGQKGMTYIFESFVKERGKPIEGAFGLPRGYCWNNVFKRIAEKMAERKREWIPKSELKTLLNIGKTKAFINKLIAEGMLNDTLEWVQGQKDPIEAVRFPYQKFSDHVIARYLLSNFLDTSDEKTIKESFDKEATLGAYFKKDRIIYARSGLVEALMIEFPTRIKNKGELLDFLDLKNVTGAVIDAFINGLIWRDPASINDATSKWVNRLLGHSQFKNRTMDTLVALAAKPKHPYNASKLNRFLKAMKMNKRDLFWSEFLRRQDYHNSIYRILSWIEMTKAQSIGKEYSQMYATIMMWTLTSINRALRDRATRAVYYIGCRFPETLFDLTIKSLEINDPYVPERMLAASYGVAMALQHERSFTTGCLQDFACQLYDLMFKKESPFSTTHILARDYVKHTIDIALLHNPDLLTMEERRRIIPPFRDGGIRRWGRSEDKNKDEYRDGNYPFGFDFNNYTIGYLLPKRRNYDFDDPEYIKVKSNMWWRIYKLGYSLKDFGEIDKDIARYDYYRFGREADGRKVDRYGKKYCWIAWHEIAGFRQDNGLLKREWEDDNHKRFTVDIDPSFPEDIQNVEIIKTNYIGNKGKILSRWITKGPTPDITPYLMLDEIQNEHGPWVLLDGFIEQEDLDSRRDVFIFPRGLFVKKAELADVVEHLRKQDLGGRWLPEISEHHYTFAGEVPWCETFPYNGKTELSFVVSTEKKRVPFEETEFFKGDRNLTGDELKELLEIITDYRDKKISEKDVNNFVVSDEIQIKKVRRFRTEMIRKTKEYEVVIPISTLNWESHESVVNTGISAYILSRELCEALELSSRPQTFDLYDKNNQRASITRRWGDVWHTFHKLIYIRKDFLDMILQDKGLDLIWGIWGERRYKAKGNAGLDDFAKKHQAYKVFQSIVVYQDIIAQREAA
ncbi:MAG: ATP-binding protein [Nitrospiraceae bacterium]|nr:ATP-binding protein [Nitrospiraceae bacterium]